jgi:hypothetical protein
LLAAVVSSEALLGEQLLPLRAVPLSRVAATVSKAQTTTAPQSIDRTHSRWRRIMACVLRLAELIGSSGQSYGLKKCKTFFGADGLMRDVCKLNITP